MAIKHQQKDIELGVYLDGLSVDVLAELVAVDADDYQRIKQLTEGLMGLGLAEQTAFWQLNDRMKFQLQKLMNDAKGGGQSVELLRNLQQQIKNIKPPKQSLTARFKSMFMLLFSWHESTWDAWLDEYPAMKNDINQTTLKLNQHKLHLHNDIKKLERDKGITASHVKQLQNAFDLLGLVKTKLTDLITLNPPSVQENIGVISDEFVPAVEQRIVELHQQLVIARQSLLTFELFIKQTESQIHSIEQSVNTTNQVLDVTVGIILVNNSQDNLTQITENQLNPNYIKTQLKEAKIDRGKLKQARLVIDQALGNLNQLSSKVEQDSE